jgi:hypothetical protein
MFYGEVVQSSGCHDKQAPTKYTVSEARGALHCCRHHVIANWLRLSDSHHPSYICFLDLFRAKTAGHQNQHRTDTDGTLAAHHTSIGGCVVSDLPNTVRSKLAETRRINKDCALTSPSSDYTIDNIQACAILGVVRNFSEGLLAACLMYLNAASGFMEVECTKST